MLDKNLVEIGFARQVFHLRAVKGVAYGYHPVFLSRCKAEGWNGGIVLEFVLAVVAYAHDVTAPVENIQVHLRYVVVKDVRLAVGKVLEVDNHVVAIIVVFLDATAGEDEDCQQQDEGM